MIKTIIFDIGNVLMTYDWVRYINEEFGAEKADVINEAVWGDGRWEELDRGVLSEEEIFRGMREHAPGYEDDVMEALKHTDHCMIKRNFAISWIQEYKAAGFRVLFLSNYSDFLLRFHSPCMDFLPYMDGGVFSYKVKLLKPDPAIYRCICDSYDLKPEECIFIDDNAANIAAANEFGIHGFLFTGYEDTRARVSEYLADESK